MTDLTLTEDDHAEVEKLLLGRRIVAATKTKVKIPDSETAWYGEAEGTLTLDDGTEIYVVGNDGGCSCGAGDYDLTHLATVDNVITAVRFEDDPDDDDDSGGIGGRYDIFVVADAKEINIASFEGSDGNGYYGTGYTLFVQLPKEATDD